MRLPPRPRLAGPRPVCIGLGLGLAAGAAVLILLLSTGGGGLTGASAHPPALADPVPYDGRSPQPPGGKEQRVLVALPRPALGALPGVRDMGREAQQKYVASLKREATALRSALGARGVKLRAVVGFERTWNGFAATVPTGDLAKLTSLGVRAQPVRRLYPATSEPVAVRGALRLPAAPGHARAPVALLDTGVDPHGPLHGRTVPGYDAVDRDSDPSPGRDPRDTQRRETSGTALAGVLAAARERVLPIRVAALHAEPDGTVDASGTSDALLAGLEHAVDPDGNADTADHVPVALVGVNAPYAGFDRSPEARAIAAAARLGTLVVAPAGNEAAAAPGSGTVGSPAAAQDALAVGALEGPEPAAGVSVEGGGQRVGEAAVLAGTPPRGPGLRTSAPVSAANPAALAGAQLAGRVALVRAGANPAAQAAAAAAAGARAVIVADPRARPLPALPSGRATGAVIGVTGAGAGALLGLRAGTELTFGPVARRRRSDAPAPPRVSPYSSQGPAAAGGAKPDLAAPGSALTFAAGAPAAVAGGTAVAAARVAAAAARLARGHAGLTAGELRAALIAAADPTGLPVDKTGGGALRPPRGPVPGGARSSGATARRPAPGSVTADPPTLAGRAGHEGVGTLTARLTAAVVADVRLETGRNASVTPPRLRLRPGHPRTVTVRILAARAGRLLARDARGRVIASVPYALAPHEAPAVPLGALELTRPHDKVDGVRFDLGAFHRGDPLSSGTAIQLAEELTLQLVSAQGTVKQTLTSPGGARELMPAEYGYTIAAQDLQRLPPGRYAFKATAVGVGHAPPATARSPAFRR